jgi:GNAT superfamily N-acetyltransferase
MTNMLILQAHRAEDYFFRSISTRILDIADGITAYMTMVPVSDLNILYIRKKPISLMETIKKAKEFFDSEKHGFVIIMNEEFDVTESTSLIESYRTFSMGINLNHFNTELDDECLIMPTDQNLDDWMLPLIGAFESTNEITTFYKTCHKNALSNGAKLYHFSLYENYKPVTSITISIHGNVARIDDLGTLPDFQGKGYATAIMKCALKEARNLGANYCFLEASKDGLSIYQKLGFETLFGNKAFNLKAN